MGVVAVLLLSFRCLATITNGTVTAWGGGDFTSIPNTPPANLGNVTAIASGIYHSLALLPDGTVRAWGQDWQGETAVPAGLSGVRAIAAGAYFSVALKSNGTVVAWGAGDGGQTNVPAGLTSVKAIAAADYHCLALRSNGTVVAWGSGVSTNVPTGLPNIVAIAAGTSHSMALGSDAKVVCWGQDTDGKADVPSWLNSYQVVAIAAGGNHSLALIRSGQIAGWGNSAYGQIYPGGLTLSSVANIAAGQNHSLVLYSNHNIFAFGDNSLNQTDVPTNLPNKTVAIAAAGDKSLALSVEAVRIVTQPQTNQSVVVGTNVSFSVVATGTPPILYQWRKNGVAISGETNSTYSLSGVQTSDSGTYSVAVSNILGYAISSNATLLVNLPPSITTQPVSQAWLVGTGPAILSVEAGGTEPLGYQWWRDSTKLTGETNTTYKITTVQPNYAGNYTVVVTNLFGSVTSAVAVFTVEMPPLITNQPQSQTVYVGTAVSFHVGASNATSYQWRKDGWPIDGQTSPDYVLAQAQGSDAGTYDVQVANTWKTVTSSSATLTVNPPPPSTVTIITLGKQTDVWNGSTLVDVTTPSSLGNVIALSAGMYHGLAIISGGTVAGWGDATYGAAIPPTGLSGVISIAAGGYHSLALTNGGGVAGWGGNGSGQATPPAGAMNLVAIAAGGNHSLALRNNGSIMPWGANNFGQATPPLSASNNVKAIAAGFNFSMCLRSNGTVAAWGQYDGVTPTFHPAYVPRTLTNAATAGVAAIAAGSYHSLALLSNGTVVAWGINDNSQTNVPAGLSGVVAIAGGARHSLALKSDGTVVGWGADEFGQIDMPPYLSGVVAIAAGGDRSLLLIQKQLVLLPPQRRAAGGITLFLANNDGTVVDASMLTKVEVRAGTNLAQNVANWVSYTTGFVLTNGLIRWDDTHAGGLKWRFYRTIERP
jgi:trimeric autotransporter adhesin